MGHKLFMGQEEAGDTLVEVLMAVVVLSMVIVGSITLMARGLAAAQIATEHTQVRQSINSQTEFLRYLRDSYLTDPTSSQGATWKSLFAGVSPYADNLASSYVGECKPTANKRPFYLLQENDNIRIVDFNPFNKPPTAAVPGRGLWVEITRSPSSITPAYVDLQFRACWNGIGGASQQTVTATRLYDPAN